MTAGDTRILVNSSSIEAHNKTLHIILKQNKKAKTTLNISKYVMPQAMATKEIPVYPDTV